MRRFIAPIIRLVVGLEPADENRMVAKGSLKVGGARGVLTTLLPEKIAAKASFPLKRIPRTTVKLGAEHVQTPIYLPCRHHPGLFLPFSHCTGQR